MIEKKYSQDWLKELCEKVDLLEYASKTHDFKRSGSDCYVAKCSKHNDINPSLTITPSNNLWYCHGCRRGGNIINWIMVYEGLSFTKTVEKIAAMLGEDIPDFKMSSSYSSLKDMYSCAILNKIKDTSQRKILDDNYLAQFKVISGEPHEWIEEGISEEVLRRYDIRIDTASNRIVYPVYDDSGRLIGVKGRTRYKNYQVLGLKKYINYQSIGTTDYFQGMHENREDIISADEVIVFEGLKSVMKLSTWGQNNSVSAETSRMNDAQVELLIKLGIGNVVIAFDNDVPYKQLRETADKLKRYTNVFIINDVKHLLGDPSTKQAPVDCGMEVWQQLYAERKRVI